MTIHYAKLCPTETMPEVRGPILEGSAERESISRSTFLDMATSLRSDGRHHEARLILERGLQRHPDNRELLEGLAGTVLACGRVKDALIVYNRLIALGDVGAQTWFAIGQALIRVNEFAQAAGAFRQSLAVAESGQARHHLGQVLFQLGDIDGALEHLEIAARESDLLASWLALATISPGAPSASQESVLRIRRQFASRLAASDLAVEPRQVIARRRGAGERLRIGYVSSWFASSNYMKPVWALVNDHDRSRFEIHLFSDSPAGTELEGYDGHADDRLHLTGDFDNTVLANLIAETGIDVLVDLNAFSTPARLGLFTSPPAPVCAAWFNMYATSGLPGYHYIIGDDEVIRPEDERHFSERVCRLSTSYLTFTTPHRTPPVVDPPCLSNGYITFGSLIAQYKMTPQVIRSWAAMLNGAPNSKLLLANRALDSMENRHWLEDRFKTYGVEGERLQFCGGAPHYQYLQNYDRIDIALDAFPYNGGTTTMEAIWQGVPVLTFDGDRWASRTSKTLLCRTHLADYVYGSPEAMIEAAIQLSRDSETPEKLKRLRHAMRHHLERAPVCDARSLARAMEDALTAMVADT